MMSPCTWFNRYTDLIVAALHVIGIIIIHGVVWRGRLAERGGDVWL